MLRRLALPAALLASLLLTSGCSRKAAEPTGGAPASQLHVLRVGNYDEPQVLDPQTINGQIEYRILLSLYEGLVGMDPKDLHPIPGLAEAWEISPDGLVYTFHLRKNLKWSNGDPLTADDFVQSYKRILSPNLASEYAYMVYNFVAGAKEYYDGKIADFSQVGFKATDDRTLRVTLKHPTPYLLKIMAQQWSWDPVPVKVIAKFGPLDRRGTGWTRPGNLVGDGPYILKTWLPQQKIVVARNPYYWDATNVKSDEIEFYPIQDVSTEERMFRTGELDITMSLPETKIDVYRKEYPQDLHIDPWLAVDYYECNVARPPLNDKRVRRALALAIDREALVRDVLHGSAEPAYALSYPGAAGYTPRAALKPNVAEARRLLAEAGYPDGKGFPPIELLYNTLTRHREIGEAIQAMWRANLGVEITLQNEEWKVYEDATQNHHYQMARAGWGADYVDPQSLLEIFDSHSGNNFTGWANPEYDRLIRSALVAKTEEERYACYQKMDAILVDECPIIPIYYTARVYAMSPKVRGWWPTLLDDHPWKYVYVEN